MINMNEIVANQGGLRYPHMQHDHAKTPNESATQPVRPDEPKDVYEKYDPYGAGYERFECGHSNSNGQAISTNVTANASKTEDTELDPRWEAEFEACKKKIDHLKSEKIDINSIIKKHAASVGISDTDIKKLKIEVNASGKIVVGGIKNNQKIKALEKALNDEAGLAGRIKIFQSSEKEVAEFFEKHNIGGMSLASGAKGLEHIKEIALKGESSEELESPLDDSLGIAASELYGIGGPDFSSGSKGVADPKGTLQKELQKAKKKIEELFNGANVQAEQFANSAGRPNGAAAADKMSLTGATIKITADGGIAIEGRFAKSDSANSQAEAIVQSVIQEMFRENENSGAESAFTTASQKLLANHDAEFGEDAGKAAVMEISGNKTNAYIDNPGRTNQINQAITTNAASFMTAEMGVTFTSDMFRVDDKGKLSLTFTPDKVDAKKAGKLLDTLNQEVKNAGANPAKPGAAATIAGLLAERTSYGQKSTFGSEAMAVIEPADDSDMVITPDLSAMSAKKSTLPPSGPPPSPHLSPEAQAKRQEAYDEQYGNPELDAMFEKWLEGEGEFNMLFLGKEVSDGYILGHTEDWKWKDKFQFTDYDEEGNIVSIRNRFYVTETGLHIPTSLDDAMSEASSKESVGVIRHRQFAHLMK